MGRRPKYLPPAAATNEGVRLLRELVRAQPFGAVARRLRCDESAIRRYAAEERSPSREMRARFKDVLGWDEGVWDELPGHDAYAASDPQTAKAPPAPTTRDRPKLA